MNKKTLKISKLTPQIIDALVSDKYKQPYLNWLIKNENKYIKDTQLLLSVIKNPNTPLKILFNLYKKGVKTDLIKKNITDKIIKLNDRIELIKIYDNFQNENFIIDALSQNPYIDENLTLAIHKDFKNLTKNLILSQKLPFEEVLKINDKSLYGLKETAFLYLSDYVSKINSPEKLEKLMNYTSSDLNYLIAQNPALNYDLFKLLSLSNDFRTRSVIASREDTPTDILYAFLEDESDTVRLALIKNKNSDKKILLTMAQKENKTTIATEIIYHINTDKEILNELILSKNLSDNIKKLTQKQLENLDALKVDNNKDYLEIIKQLTNSEFENIDLEEEKHSEERKTIKVNLKD